MNTALKTTTIMLASLLSMSSYAAPVPGQGTWELTLASRDINADGRIDAYYDSTLNITWLLDAWPLGGNTVSWEAASSYATNLNVFGVTGWRLPRTIDAASSQAFRPPVDSSELANMYYGTLGNRDLGLVNTGPFSNLQSYVYWSETTPQTDPSMAWIFLTSIGSQGTSSKSAGLYAWAVHDGDVASVPEPQSASLALLGLLGLAMLHRYRNRQLKSRHTDA